MTQLLTDEDVVTRLDARTAVATMRDAIVAGFRGELVAPARVPVPLGGGRLLITAGQWGDRWYGYRSYDTFGYVGGDQLTVLHDGATGRVRAIALGVEMGIRRTGAIGAVAVDALARADATTLGVIGTGRQAWGQVWAIAAVRRISDIRVFSRTPEARAVFAARCAQALGVPAVGTGSASEAVTGRDIVVLATSSPVPVIDPADLAPGTHVTTLGPKQRGRAEFGPELAAVADLIVTDSPAQVAGYDPPFVLDGPPPMHLGAILDGAAPGRDGATEITLFCSVGLAGTEVALLAALT